MFKFYRALTLFLMDFAVSAHEHAIKQAQKDIARNERTITALEARRDQLANENEQYLDWLGKQNAVVRH